MRFQSGVLIACILAGCAGSPPKPPTFKGEYHPVNKAMIKQASNQAIAASTFDFAYEGDILNSLDALRIKQPQIKVLSPLGKASPLPVRINLKDTTLETALKAIGEQGGNVADVVWNTTKNQHSNEVFIRFHAPVEVSGSFSVTNQNVAK